MPVDPSSRTRPAARPPSAPRTPGRIVRAAITKSKESRAQSSSAAQLGRSLMRLAERAMRAVAAHESRTDKSEKSRQRVLMEAKAAPPPPGDGPVLCAMPEAEAPMWGHLLLYQRKAAAALDHGVPEALLGSFADPASSYVVTMGNGQRMQLIDHDTWHQRTRGEKAALKAGAVEQLRGVTSDERQFDSLCEIANNGAWEALQKVQRSWNTPVHLNGRRGQFLDGDVSRSFEITKLPDGKLSVRFDWRITGAQSFYPLDGGPRVPLSLTNTPGDAAFSFEATLEPDGTVQWSGLRGGVATPPGSQEVELQERPQTKSRLDGALKVLNDAG